MLAMILLFLAVPMGDCPHELGFVNNELPPQQGTQVEISYRYYDSQTWTVSAVVPAGVYCFAHPPSPKKRCFRVRRLNPNSTYSQERCELTNPSNLTVAP